MISVRFTMVSGKTHQFNNVQSTIDNLGLQCANNINILMLGGNGKTVVIVGRHVESIEEL